MIAVEVQKTRGTFKLDAKFALPRNGIIGFFGRSGAGKSTIIDLISGTLTPDRGTIAIGDRIFVDTASGRNVPVEQRRIGYVFQDSRLFPHMNVAANLRYGLKRARTRRATSEFDDVVALLDLSALLKQRPHTLSGGERQRVAIARALLSQPELLLMDEPLASLDAPRKAEIMTYIERLQADYDVPILYVSHALDELIRLADHLVIIANGKVFAYGNLMALVGRTDLQPYLARFDAGAVWECVVKDHDPVYEITLLQFADGELRVPLVSVERGTRIRTRLRARDVALSLSEPTDSSVTNRLRGVVDTITPRDGPYVDVRIVLGKTAIHALVTRQSTQRLALAPGTEVWALIKSVALDNRAVGFTIKPRNDAAADTPLA